tara:strand:+ start:6622 stop:8229 length:1608 start_codon:yes stop_codon:yes gene_type:complete
MREFSAKTREENIEKFPHHVYDVLIVGGGINGAGIARDAASRGMKVALVEADDFASGTSSRSSKLIHGGIRYLENLEFSLVFEALSERAKLFDIAPHLSHPLRFVLPVYEGARVGMLQLGLGMALYDLLSLYEAPELFEHLNKDEAMQRLPMLDPKGLKGAYVYSDGYMDDDRLVIESLRSANEMGADIANYMKVVEAHYQDEKITAMTCEDVLSGKQYSIRAKHFIGGLGPWTDIFADNVLKKWRHILRPTKGIHITVAKERAPLKQAVVMFSDDQKRIIFGIPRHEMVIFGTTDTDYPGNPREVKTEKEDIDYLLAVVNKYFPGLDLIEKDILSSYSGVRPLVDDGSSSEGKTSREHVIIEDEQNITFVAGGKYTTYRLMAKEVVDAALNSFSAEDRMSFHPSDTDKAINPMVTADLHREAMRLSEVWARNSKFSLAEIKILAARHGLETEEILQRERASTKSIWQLEAKHAAAKTMCLNLRDFYLRRSPLFLSEPDHGLSLLPILEDLFADAARGKELLEQHIQQELRWRQS